VAFRARETNSAPSKYLPSTGWLLRAAPGQPLPAGPGAAHAYGLLPAGGGAHTVSLIGPGPDFDPRYAMTTDLDEPVIIATIASPDGEPAGPLLIDGYALPVIVQLRPQHRNGCGRASRGVPGHSLVQFG
jgi:hypothetical protein